MTGGTCIDQVVRDVVVANIFFIFSQIVDVLGRGHGCMMSVRLRMAFDKVTSWASANLGINSIQKLGIVEIRYKAHSALDEQLWQTAQPAWIIDVLAHLETACSILCCGVPK